MSSNDQNHHTCPRAKLSRCSVRARGHGRESRRPCREIAALRLGLDLGMTLIDTAEMYAGAAPKGRRRGDRGPARRGIPGEQGLPPNATRGGAVRACERSLKRLATDRIDLYLLHWRGGVPLARRSRHSRR